MKISALEEYGLRCMLALTEYEEQAALTLPEISEMEGLSLPYTGKILMLLRKAGLVQAERGRNGGYILARSSEDITLRDIFEGLGEPIYSSQHCLKHSGEAEECVHADNCYVRDIWSTLDKLVSEFQQNITLAEISNRTFSKTDVLKRISLTV